MNDIVIGVNAVTGDQGSSTRGQTPMTTVTVGDAAVPTVTPVTTVNGGPASTEATQAPTDAWVPPLPLPIPGDPPPFPIDALAPWLREWAKAVARAVQTPIDLPVAVALGMISLAVAKKYVVMPWAGWQEPLNVYIVAALAPGEGKSPVFKLARVPLATFEREVNQRRAVDIARSKEHHAMLLERQKRVRQQLANARSGDDAITLQTEADDLAADIACFREAHALRLIADDITTEALEILMFQQGGRIGVISSEGGPFELIGGRYTDKQPNFSIYLKAYSADEHSVDRVGRATGQVKRPSIVMCVTTQPGVVDKLGADPELRQRGFLARLWYIRPKSLVGTREARPPVMPEPTQSSYSERLRRLFALPEQRDEDNEIAATELPLDAAAVERFVEFRRSVEERLKEDGDLRDIAEWANKAGGSVLRLAGLLHVADCADDDASILQTVVPASVVERAIRIGHYLLDHARRAFDFMSVEKSTEAAPQVLRWIKTQSTTQVTKRDIHRRFQRLFKTADAIDPVLTLLVGHGYLRAVRPGLGDSSKKESFEVNPLEPTKAEPPIAHAPSAPAPSADPTVAPVNGVNDQGVAAAAVGEAPEGPLPPLTAMTTVTATPRDAAIVTTVNGVTACAESDNLDKGVADQRVPPLTAMTEVADDLAPRRDSASHAVGRYNAGFDPYCWTDGDGFIADPDAETAESDAAKRVAARATPTPLEPQAFADEMESTARSTAVPAGESSRSSDGLAEHLEELSTDKARSAGRVRVEPCVSLPPIAGTGEERTHEIESLSVASRAEAAPPLWASDSNWKVCVCALAKEIYTSRTDPVANALHAGLRDVFKEVTGGDWKSPTPEQRTKFWWHLVAIKRAAPR